MSEGRYTRVDDLVARNATLRSELEDRQQTIDDLVAACEDYRSTIRDLSEKLARRDMEVVELRAKDPADTDMSRRQRQVWRLLAYGYTNVEIGEALAISTGTAKQHVAYVLRKSGARNRANAAYLFALRYGRG